MKRFSILDLLVFCSLVALGVASRWLLLDWPNFTATGAVALFAGFYFRHIFAAVATAFSVLCISNLLLPSYAHTGDMIAVYAAFLVPAVLGALLRRRVTFGRAAAGLLMPSLVFFVATNPVSWFYNCGPTAMYDATLGGLMTSYWYAVPFYRNMFCADVLFSGALFGAYAVAVNAYVFAANYRWLPGAREPGVAKMPVELITCN
jgi:hypothetical protein